RVTGAIPAYAARWPGVSKAVPSPMFRRIWAAVWGHLPRGAWGNADPRHAHQDRGEREILQYGLYLPRHGRPLLLQFLHLTSDSGDHEFHCRGRRHDDGLLAQRREDRVDQRFGIAARMGAGETQDPGPACRLEPGGAAKLLQQVQHEPGGKAPADEDALERGMDLRQQGPDPVQRPGGLVGELLVEAREELGWREDFAVAGELAERVGHGAGGVGDDESLPRIGLLPVRIQVRGLPHR